MSSTRGKLTVFILILQTVFVILFGLLVEYDIEADASDPRNSKGLEHGGPDPDANPVRKYYPMFQDVHVMIFIGFGFLMTFLKRYGYSAVGVNMLLGAVVLQWATLCQGFFHNHGGKIHVDITSLLNADFASATVLISFGALLGKTSPLQLLVMAIVEIVIFAANEWVGLHVFWTSDVGASVLVHVFGAYFGLMVSLALHRPDIHQTNKEGAVYHSDVFAMIGTIFLWLFWPSFNAALAPGHAQHRVVINTYYALAACCVTTFAFSSLVDKHSRFNMVHVQNSTLAGGVAIGTAADLMIEPWGAMLVGIAAGFLSVLGYQYITPFMAKHLRIHDTCGVHNLHGMPGVLAGIIGAILASLASEENYGKNLYEQYPMRAPPANTSELAAITAVMGRIEPGKGWSASSQAGYQLAALFMTLAVACVGGLITGIILRLPFLDPLSTDQLFDDEDFWEIPEEEPLVVPSHVTPVKQEDSKTFPTNGAKDADVLTMAVF
uniref:Rh-related protein n=1 Tax=Scolopendra viridis TaxID=118503 RepID=A0A4D5R9D1_SCOVI